MGFFTWIKGLLQPQEDTIRVNCQTMPLAKWRRNGGYQPCSHGGTPNPPPSDFDDYLDAELACRRGSNPPAPGSKPAAPSGPPTKPQPTGGRLIYTDRDPGPVNQSAPAPAEMPSDELMERWKLAAIVEHAKGGEPMWHTAALLAFAEGRQQAQSLQLPPPGADPVATKEDLTQLWFEEETFTDFGRTLYEKGRADERTAILRAMGVKP
jgi:hypothetical protein